jgi:hypothetical protein
LHAHGGIDGYATAMSGAAICLLAMLAFAAIGHGDLSPAGGADVRRSRATCRQVSFMQLALLDAAEDAYADWLHESFGVERLYGRWSDAARGERALAFAAYAAALEREERAAAVYADTVRMAAQHTRAR